MSDPTYILEDDLGNTLAMRCTYVSIGPQRGEMNGVVSAAPFSIFQNVNGDIYANPSALKLEGAEFTSSQHPENVPLRLDAIRTFIKKAVKLRRSNDTDIDLIPCQQADVLWEYGEALYVTGKVTIVLYPRYRLDKTGTNGNAGGIEQLPPPPMPIEVVTIPGPTGPQGPQGTPGRGIPEPVFPDDEGKIAVARNTATDGIALEALQNLVSSGSGIAVEALSNNRIRITNTASDPGTNLGPRVTTLENGMNEAQLEAVEDRLGYSTLPGVDYDDSAGRIRIPYDREMTWLGLPTGGESRRIMISQNVRMYPGNVCRALGVPTNNAHFDVYRNGDLIAQIEFSAGSSTGIMNFLGGEYWISFDAFDWLVINNQPTADDTLSDIYMVFGFYLNG